MCYVHVNIFIRLWSMEVLRNQNVSKMTKLLNLVNKLYAPSHHSLVCVNDTQKWQFSEKWERPGILNHMNNIRWA